MIFKKPRKRELKNKIAKNDEAEIIKYFLFNGIDKIRKEIIKAPRALLEAVRSVAYIRSKLNINKINLLDNLPLIFLNVA